MNQLPAYETELERLMAKMFAFHPSSDLERLDNIMWDDTRVDVQTSKLFSDILRGILAVRKDKGVYI